jgi:peptidoglycan/LPS O-acetylase OafA/YrhL
LGLKAQQATNTWTSTNLDLLRAAAVLLVFAGHLARFFNVEQVASVPLIGLGGLGVAIFFVHTALVLMMSLEREAAKSKVLFVPFMIRRCFRIYPLSMFVVLAVAAFHIPQATISPAHFAGWNFDAPDLLSNLFLVQNLSFRVPLVGPMWSLAYELEMYLLLPAIFLFLRRTRWSWRLGAALAVVVSLCVAIVQTSATRNLAFYAPCFLAGILAYELKNYGDGKVYSWLWPVFVGGLAVVYLKSDMTRWDEWLICLLLGLAIPVFARIVSRTVNKTSELIAKYSYGIYLTHFFVIWLAFEKLAGLALAWRIGVFVSLAVGLPVIFYHLLEEPMIQVGKRLAAGFIAERESQEARRALGVEGGIGAPALGSGVR